MKKIPCEVFSRVVGYYRPVAWWNEGKKAEFGDRKYFKVEVKNDKVCSSITGSSGPMVQAP